MAFGRYIYIPSEAKYFRRQHDIPDDAFYEACGIDALLGKTIVAINGGEKDFEWAHFVCSDGTEYLMFHEQDCCESVTIEDVCGDFKRLLNSPITMAEDISNEVVDETVPNEDDYSHTWTWYKLATVNEYVTIRWYGTSNGYYSESVDFARIK